MSQDRRASAGKEREKFVVWHIQFPAIRQRQRKRREGPGGMEFAEDGDVHGAEASIRREWRQARLRHRGSGRKPQREKCLYPERAEAW